MSSLLSRRLWTAPTAALSLVLLAPVAVVLASVFVSSGDIWRHLQETVLADYIRNSLWLMLGVGALALPLGVIPAWLVTSFRFPLGRQLEWALLLPLAFPAYIIAYTYTGLLDFAGPAQSWLREAFGAGYWFPEVRSLPGAAVMLALVLYPYVYLLTRAAFQEQSACAVEAARVLGAGPARAFFRVALPLARPAIVAGLSLALMETLADYGVVQYFGVATFTTGIFRTWFGLGSSVAAAQLSALLMGFVLVLILLENRARKQARYHHATTRRRIAPKRLHGWRSGLAFALCALPVGFGFIIPAAQLSVWAAQTYGASMNRQFLALAWHSVELALIASALALGAALALAYARRLQPGPLTYAVNRLLSLGYAVPGTVIAIGVLLPFTWLDRQLAKWLDLLLDVDAGLALSGTIAILVFAYLTRFLAVSLNTVEAGLEKIRPAMDEASRSAGVGGFGLLRRVHGPMMRSSLLAAALLVFVEVLKELPATLILRPFNYNTLAVRAFELANDERLAAASLPALAIVLVGIIPVMILNRLFTARIAHVE